MKQMLINRHDYELFLQGLKSATSRYGERLDEFVPGERFEFKVNDGSEESTLIEIERAYVKPLKELTELEAVAIGNYSLVAAIVDFTAIYSKLNRHVDENTPVTVVWFRKA